MLQAQNPKLVCQPSTTTHNFRQAIEESNSVEKSMVDSYTCGLTHGMTYKVQSHHFHGTHMYTGACHYTASHRQPQFNTV